ncbi:MAG: Hpt domain-containing protein [Terasakiella sp.]|uniref:Hpt domain-containing protein n=1 Tax=unclassified Terasakiella TaxID=2614952 RepID=UPI003AFF64D6
MPSSKITDKLAALTERFKQRLRDTQTHISQWQNAGHIKELIEISHKLAGTAGTYGFHELSTGMKELELHLLEISDQTITEEQALELYKKANALLSEAL